MLALICFFFAIVQATGVLELLGQKRNDENLAKSVHGNDDKRDTNEEAPFPGCQWDCAEEFATNDSEDDLNNKDDGEDDDEPTVVCDIVEDVDLGGAHIEGINTGYKNEEGEEGGEESIVAWLTVSNEQEGEVVIDEEDDGESCNEEAIDDDGWPHVGADDGFASADRVIKHIGLESGLSTKR